MKKRENRLDEIRRIVRTEAIRTQRQLSERLKSLGYECTQATVSRDITELGLHKLPDGRYVPSEDVRLHRMVSELAYSVIRTNNMVLVKTSPGTAQGVAAALDAAGVEGVLGSIAGDDTILIIAADDDAADDIATRLDELRGAL